MKIKKQLSPFSVIIVFVALIIIGVSLIPLINLQLEPSRSLPSISVSYTWANASARVIEQEVTSKLEGVFNSIKGIKKVSSISKKGTGRINLEFKKGSNMDAIRFEVAMLIRRSYPDLPAQVSYPTLSLGTGGQKSSPILTYTINASASPFFIQKYAEDNIATKISGIKGVTEVKVYGASPFEWEIVFNTDAIDYLNIEVNEIATAINNYFRKEIIGIGSVQAEGKDFLNSIRLALQNNIPNNLKWNEIPIKKNEDRIIWLTDIANISFKEQAPNSYFRINGLNTINMVVYPEDDANSVKLAKNVKETIEVLKASLPAGYSILLARDSTEFIAKELRKIAYRTLFSMLILLLFVGLITRSFRYLLLITISLFANLIVAFIFYYLLQIEIHLYSLAGITVSFGILIDNSIIMIDHIRHHNNKKAFLAILAATLTTIGSLSIIFFLKEKQQINLIDFALVIMVNLSVSMFIALFFIPALMEKIKLGVNRKKSFFRRKRRALKFTWFYTRSIVFGKKFKWVFLSLFILGFGIPIHWLPATIEQQGFWAETYNKSIGSSWYQDNTKPIAEKIMGGTLRLFTEHVFESSFYSDPEQTKLYVRGTMPEGCTVQQLNEAMQKMENYISRYDEIELFQTSISNYQNSNITIHFKPEFENGSFPFFLKEELTSKAISLGGLDWSVYGVGRGFSNALYSGYKNSSIVLEGYNYNQLYGYAEELRTNLLENERIQEVDINGGSSSSRTQTLNEYFIDFNLEKFGLKEISLIDFHTYLNSRVYKQQLSPVFYNNENQPVSLVSNKAGDFNVWDLKNSPILVNAKMYKLSELGQIEKRRTGNDIYKENQQYQLNVAYDFIGPGPLSKMVKNQQIEIMNDLLPLGYLAKDSSSGWWNKNDKKQYYLLLLVIAIIYLLCSVLFESLVQPLVIIAMIPISYIGVFLTFYLFDFNFDQGGFASFILLSGIVVNAGLYIINDYNQLKKRGRSLTNMELYTKAFNHKIIPIFLTIISTVLGLIPFVWLGQNEVFWFAFAAGSIGGLLFSFVALIIYMPLFMRLKIK
jgi:multidrug efflux pump subunit AcrB